MSSGKRFIIMILVCHCSFFLAANKNMVHQRSTSVLKGCWHPASTQKHWCKPFLDCYQTLPHRSVKPKWFTVQWMYYNWLKVQPWTTSRLPLSLCNRMNACPVIFIWVKAFYFIFLTELNPRSLCALVSSVLSDF